MLQERVMHKFSVPLSLSNTDITVFNIIRDIIGGAQLDSFSQTILIPDPLATFGDENVPRAHLAMSLFLVLYADLLDRVPHAREYFERKHENEETIFLDHGAVRTVDTIRTGDLPAGQEALTRILIPLGYFHNETYPLTKLKMTGRSYTHTDFPDVIPQYFVSEFHPEQVGDDDFEKAVLTTVEESIEPLSQEILDDLSFIAENGYLPRSRATSFLSNAAAAFNRQHPVPLLSVYEELLQHSAEMAWIATEGNSFNHATDRVEDVMELAEHEKSIGSPIKDSVEVSSTGRVLQTAYKADIITRHFRLDDNETIEKEVPGSFFEFITRKVDDEGKIDLAFDANNATGIFAMTRDESGAPVSEFEDADIEED
jgi:hypothetical protein